MDRQQEFSQPFGHVIRAAQEYCLDAWQRGVLLLDILRERGDNYFTHNAQDVPHALRFSAELVRDGRTLPRPVNYGLARIIPPEGVTLDPAKPPFVVVDPRAGHGPGIGGMKADSEIGMALAAGHACYFIGFAPKPMPGQTLEDVCRAEAVFIEEVAARHREAEGKPVVIANCQAGWQTMIMAAVNPDLTGPILLAGSPLSYWAGVRGKNPMRYLGGLLGGSWMTALASDLGDGLFDGAYLVANFESLDLANTYWRKLYNVYSKVDTEGPRFLEFEKWWGSPVLSNGAEMQWIVDNLFVGDKLATGGLRTSDGLRIDLRNVKSPIIVFCSWGDNITPPQQALDWITALYDDEREIAANGQTIVYTLNDKIGHLGIFVSGKIATKEYREFTNCMDLIYLMPPGLYEAVITEVEEDTANPELINGKYLFRLQARTLDDIRALGANSPEDERRFATVARVSEVNNGLYQTFAGPAVRAITSEMSAEALRQLNPNRLRFTLFSDRNPMMGPIADMAAAVRRTRAPAAKDNPFLALEATASSLIESTLEAVNRVRDAWTETVFLNTYGSPFLQVLMGLGPQRGLEARRIERDLTREADEAQLRSELEQHYETGGAVEAVVRAVIYAGLPIGGADERGIAMARTVRAAKPADKRRSASELKETVKAQYLLVRLDEERAVEAIPKLLPRNADERRAASKVVHEIIEARGKLPEESRRRLRRVDALFNGKAAGHA